MKVTFTAQCLCVVYMRTVSLVCLLNYLNFRVCSQCIVFLFCFCILCFLRGHICIKNKNNKKQHKQQQKNTNNKKQNSVRAKIYKQSYKHTFTTTTAKKKKKKKKDNNSNEDDLCTVLCWLHLMCVCLSLMLLSKVCLP